MPRRRRKIADLAPMVGYTRVSTTEQAESGLGLESQARSIKQYADLYQLPLAADLIVDDGHSGKDLNRPGMQLLIAKLQRGECCGVIASKLDRLTRSNRDLGMLIETYFMEDSLLRLVLVTEQVDSRTAGGRLVLNLLGSVNQWEREQIGERTKAALKAKRARGERAGSIPYGFELDPTDPKRQAIQRCEREHVALQEALRMKTEGMTTQQIADVLTKKHRKAARGVRFYQPFVWKMLQNKET